jgi:hypothetical protein
MKEIEKNLNNYINIDNKKGFFGYNLYVNFTFINNKINKIEFFAGVTNFIFKLIKHE